MRLITRTVFIFIAIATVAFVIGGFISLKIFSNEVKKEERWFLQERLKSTEKYIARRQPQEEVIRDKVMIMPVQDSIPVNNPVFSDTIVYHSTLERPELHNKLEVGKKIEDRYYKIILFDIIIEQDDIVDGVVESLLLLYLILILLVLFFSWLLSKKALSPFEKTLKAIQSFDIKEEHDLTLTVSNTLEFKRLNQFISSMTKKVRADYVSLKEFTENASHEIQTPISIIKGKLDILKETSLSKEQEQLVLDSERNLLSLSQLSKTLTLLTKIDNQEFKTDEEIDLSSICEEIINDYEELISLKGISLHHSIQPNIYWLGNETLYKVMLTNLMNNAIKHNLNENAFIEITLTSKELTIVNSGADYIGDPHALLQRFKKGNQSSSSLGLGLSIIKKIADYYQLGLEYSQSDKRHSIRLTNDHIA